MYTEVSERWAWIFEMMLLCLPFGPCRLSLDGGYEFS